MMGMKSARIGLGTRGRTLLAKGIYFRMNLGGVSSSEAPGRSSTGVIVATVVALLAAFIAGGVPVWMISR
jgi:hypothetical protein